jgi:5-methylcytosine-specific restriction endonuclease McrA
MKPIEKKLDILWSKAVKLRDKTCRVCGATPIDAHHVLVKRRHKKTRWSMLNGIGLCRYCHSQAHLGNNRYMVQVALDAIVPKEQQESIEIMGREIWKPGIAWLNDRMSYLERSIKDVDKHD